MQGVEVKREAVLVGTVRETTSSEEWLGSRARAYVYTV